MDDVKTLNRNIKTYWTNQHNSGHKGLLYLNEAMLHFAKHGDWTPLARMLALADKEKSILWAIVRMSFGEANVSSKPDKKGEFGFKLVKGWEGNDFPLGQQNGYGILSAAIDNNKSFRSSDFQKQVREALGKKEKKQSDKTSIQEMEAFLKHVLKKMEESPTIKAYASDFAKQFERQIQLEKDKDIAF
jgi:hypothetical protein